MTKLSASDAATAGNLSKSPIELEIQLKQLEFLYGQNTLAALSTLIAGILLGWVLWEVVDHIRIIIWLAILAIATVGRVILVQQFKKALPSPLQAQTWRKRILAVAVLFGALWGSVSLFLFAESSIPHIAFTGFVIVGIAAGAVPYLASVWVVYLLTALPATLLFSMRLIFLGDEIAIAMAIFMFLFSVMMIFTSWRMKEIVIESIKLRFDKNTLASDLQLAKTVKEQATIVAKESDERAHVLAEAPFEGIFVHEDGQILDANSTLLKLLGMRLEEALGRQVLDFVDTSSRELVQQELQNPTGNAFTTSITRPDGLSMTVEVRGRHFPRKGRTIRVVSIRPAE